VHQRRAQRSLVLVLVSGAVRQVRGEVPLPECHLGESSSGESETPAAC